MLEHEMNLFKCLGWTEDTWKSDHHLAKQITEWEKVKPDLQVCATAVGYNKHNWQVSLLNLFDANRQGHDLLIWYFLFSYSRQCGTTVAYLTARSVGTITRIRPTSATNVVPKAT
jgi:hypothetical protein